MKESDFRSEFLAYLRARGIKGFAIETGSTKLGVPDVLFFPPPVQFPVFVELKRLPSIEGSADILGRKLQKMLSPEQQAFFEEYGECMPVFVVGVSVPKPGYRRIVAYTRDSEGNDTDALIIKGKRDAAYGEFIGLFDLGLSES